MNNRGFTLIELIMTFCLTSIIVFLLINVVTIMQEVYIKSNTRTKLLIEQANLSKSFNSNEIVSWDYCYETEFCYELTFSDSSKSRLEVTENSIKFKDYSYNLDENSKVVAKEFSTVDCLGCYKADKFLVIKIDIKNEILGDEDFGINFIKPYYF